MTVEELRGRRITELREQLLWTREELAKRAGMSPTTVGLAEQGATHLRLGSIRKLAEALGIDPQELLHPKAQAPSSKLNEADEARREADVTLINSWAIALEDLRDELQELLGDLPPLPDNDDDLRVRRAEIQALIKRFYSIQHAVNDSGASHRMWPYVEAKESREYLPNDLYGAITDYQGAQKALKRDLIPRAEMWEARAKEIMEGLKAAETEPTRPRDAEKKT